MRISLIIVGLGEETVTKADHSKRIDEELVCVDSLAHDLRQRCGCREIQVQREENDPPDFWVDVDGQRYAAEVTSITTRQAYQATCRALKEAVGNAARNQGCLNGIYALLMRRKPDLPRRASADWRSLVAKAVSFVQGTASEESTEESLLLANRQGRLSIRKMGAAGTAVGLLGATEAKWQGNIREELQELMQEAVTTKRVKLEKKGVPAQCPEIFLVFYDAYGFGEPDDPQHALLETTGYRWFHSVFWAASFANRDNALFPDSPGRFGKFLYSRRVDWWESRSTPCT